MTKAIQPGGRPREAVLRSRRQRAATGLKIRKLCSQAAALREARPKRAFAAAHEAFRLATLCGDEPGAAAALLQLSRVRHLLGDHLDALTHGRQALARFSALGDEPGMLDSLMALGPAYGSLGRISHARDCFSRALPLARRLNRIDQSAAAVEGVGLAAFYQEDFAKAGREFLSALRLARQARDARREAGVLLNLANCLNSMGRRDRAEARYQHSLRLLIAGDDRAGESLAFYNIGVMYVEWGKPEKALPVLDRGLALARELGARRLAALCHYALGMGYEALQREERAAAEYRRAAKAAAKIGHPRVIYQASAALARLLRRRGENIRAATAAKTALAAAEMLRAPAFIAEARRLLAPARPRR